MQCKLVRYLPGESVPESGAGKDGAVCGKYAAGGKRSPERIENKEEACAFGGIVQV